MNFKSILASGILGLLTISPALANEYPTVLKPVSVEYVNAQR